MKPLITLSFFLLFTPAFSLAQDAAPCERTRGSSFGASLFDLTQNELVEMQNACDEKFVKDKRYDGSEIIASRSIKRTNYGNVFACVSAQIDDVEKGAPACDKQFSSRWSAHCCPSAASEFRDVGGRIGD